MSKPRTPRQAPSAPTLPEHACPQHGVLMEPVGALDGTPYYWCPKGEALRAWRSIFKPVDKPSEAK